VVAILGALVAALLAAELGLRVWAAWTGHERGMRFDPEVGWRLLPRVARQGPEWGVSKPARTNARGWRDAEFDPADRARARVLALGDSFTWGAGVDDGERWTDELERIVPALDVWNWGVNAWGPDQALRALESEGLSDAPDAVVAQVFLGNDLSDVLFARHFDWPKPYFAPQGAELRLVPPQRSADVVLRESCYLGELAFRVLGGALERNVRAPELADVDGVLLVASIVERMARGCAVAGARFVCVLVHEREHVAGAPTETALRLEALLRGRGVTVLSLRDAFAERLRVGDELYLADGYWSPAGHALAAREIATALAAASVRGTR
jgi:hypothetical protein